MRRIGSYKWCEDDEGAMPIIHKKKIYTDGPMDGSMSQAMQDMDMGMDDMADMHEMHDHEMHDHEMHDHEMHDHEMHDHEMHDHEMHDHKMHDMHKKHCTHKTHDHEMHDHEMPGMHKMHHMQHGMQLAHSYVPWQHYDQAFCPREALMIGTLFPELWGVYPIPE